MDIGKLKVDAEKEKGTWVEIAPGCSVKVAYTNSKEYRQALSKKLRPYRTMLSKTKDYDSIPESEQDRIAIGMLLDHTLFDWKGVEYKGKSVAFSRETAEAILTDVPEFRQLIEEAAGNMSNFREEQREEDAKNLETASAGT